jgi:uncharacterized protein YecE (DUF72 family)
MALCRLGRERAIMASDGGDRPPTEEARDSPMPLPPGPMIGTCGFSYQEWRGGFYPPGMPPSEWLAFYAENFDALELDGSFYRPPARAVVAGWAAALPERFAMSLKVPREITHEARLAGEPAAGMLRAFAASLEPLGDRLLAVLLQLPPSLTAGEGRDRLARLLATRPAGLPVVVEVRHPSWDAPWLPGLLADVDASLARVEWPEVPAMVEWTGPIRYGRLLGDREGTPNVGAKVRDLPGDLDRWVRLATAATGDPALAKAFEGHRPVALFANNRFEGAAFTTAIALRRRLGQPAEDPVSRWPEPPLPGLWP